MTGRNKYIMNKLAFLHIPGLTCLLKTHLILYGGWAAPLQAAPLWAAHLRAAPLRAAPLRAAPLLAAPLRAAPLLAAHLWATP